MSKTRFLLSVCGIFILIFWQISCTTGKPTIGTPQQIISMGEEKLPPTDQQKTLLLLADRHKTKGVECNDCHKEQPPDKAVSTSVCITCHEGYLQSTEPLVTGKKDPHNSHLPVSECEACHHVHKPSEDQCAACHNFGFQIP